MVPQQKFQKPGKSPFMNMMLVPVYADAGGDLADWSGESIGSWRRTAAAGARAALTI